jgi:restriction system protein
MDTFFLILREPTAWIPAGAVLLAWFTRTSWFIGWIGELKLRLKIDFRLDGRRFHPFHNVLLSSSEGTTQIDHVVISTHGVFVIETKNMKGWIYGSERDRKWTQQLWRQKYTFMNPLRQNYKHVKAVEEALDLAPRFVHSVVVFVGRAKFKTLMPSNVVRLDHFVSYIRSTPMIVFSDDEVRALVVRLKRAVVSIPLARWHHLSQVRKNRLRPTCPKCRSRMVLKTARKGRHRGTQFWSCSTFPRCRGLLPVDG